MSKVVNASDILGKETGRLAVESWTRQLANSETVDLPGLNLESNRSIHFPDLASST